MELIQHKNKWYIKSNTGYREVLATTDKSLTFHDKTPIGENINGLHKQLPQIPQQFIEEYVKAGGIDEVLLECSHWNTTNIWNEDEKAYDITLDSYKLKTDQNNCVIIHPIEPKLYTKEELLRDYISYHYVEGNITNEQRVKMEFAAAAYLQKIEQLLI